jgi:hypothetical protein
VEKYFSVRFLRYCIRGSASGSKPEMVEEEDEERCSVALPLLLLEACAGALPPDSSLIAASRSRSASRAFLRYARNSSFSSCGSVSES